MKTLCTGEKEDRLSVNLLDVQDVKSVTGNFYDREVRLSPEKRAIHRTSGMAHGEQFEQDA